MWGFCVLFLLFLLVVLVFVQFVLFVFSMLWDSLYFVQLFFWLSNLDGDAWKFTNSVSGKYKLVKRPGGSHEGVGREKKEKD